MPYKKTNNEAKNIQKPENKFREIELEKKTLMNERKKNLTQTHLVLLCFISKDQNLLRLDDEPLLFSAYPPLLSFSKLLPLTLFWLCSKLSWLARCWLIRSMWCESVMRLVVLWLHTGLWVERGDRLAPVWRPPGGGDGVDEAVMVLFNVEGIETNDWPELTDMACLKILRNAFNSRSLASNWTKKIWIIQKPDLVNLRNLGTTERWSFLTHI